MCPVNPSCQIRSLDKPLISVIRIFTMNLIKLDLRQLCWKCLQLSVYS